MTNTDPEGHPVNLPDVPWKLVTLACVLVVTIGVVAVFAQNQLGAVIAGILSLIGGLGALLYGQVRQSAQIQALHVTTNGNTARQMDQNAALTRALAMAPPLTPEQVAVVFPTTPPKAAS